MGCFLKFYVGHLKKFLGVRSKYKKERKTLEQFIRSFEELDEILTRKVGGRNHVLRATVRTGPRDEDSLRDKDSEKDSNKGDTLRDKDLVREKESVEKGDNPIFTELLAYLPFMKQDTEKRRIPHSERIERNSQRFERIKEYSEINQEIFRKTQLKEQLKEQLDSEKYKMNSMNLLKENVPDDFRKLLSALENGGVEHVAVDDLIEVYHQVEYYYNGVVQTLSRVDEGAKSEQNILPHLDRTELTAQYMRHANSHTVRHIQKTRKHNEQSQSHSQSESQSHSEQGIQNIHREIKKLLEIMSFLRKNMGISLLAVVTNDEQKLLRRRHEIKNEIKEIEPQNLKLSQIKEKMKKPFPKNDNSMSDSVKKFIPFFRNSEIHYLFVQYLNFRMMKMENVLKSSKLNLFVIEKIVLREIFIAREWFGKRVFCEFENCERPFHDSDRNTAVTESVNESMNTPVTESDRPEHSVTESVCSKKKGEKMNFFNFNKITTKTTKTFKSFLHSLFKQRFDQFKTDLLQKSILEKKNEILELETVETVEKENLISKTIFVSLLKDVREGRLCEEGVIEL